MIVLRIIISIILLIIYLSCLIITPKCYANNLSNIFIKLILYVCNLTKINIINKDIFDKYYNSNKPFIVVSNHTTLWDGLMLNNAFCRLRYLAAKSADKMIFGTKYIFDKLDCIIVKESGTVRTIQENVKDRKTNDNILVIFPDAMEQIPNGRNIAPFKTGAFATGIDILPILIKYKDYIEGVVCVAYTDDIPTTVKELDLMSKDEGTIAVAYTVWSLKKGAGKKIMEELLRYMKYRNKVESVMTLSPLTPMATHFHIRNGAKLIQINPTTQNFEYKV